MHGFIFLNMADTTATENDRNLVEAECTLFIFL